MEPQTIHDYSVKEEIYNAITHGLGTIFGIVALCVFINVASQQNDKWKLISGIMFGSTLIIMYLSSTLYHGFSRSKLKRFFKTMDHAAIYLLIAGTFTPYSLVNLRGDWGWTLFYVTWGIAIFGVIFKIFFVGRFAKISLASYLLMGWIAVAAIVPLCRHVKFAGLMWMAAGGLSYTLGTIFFAIEKYKYMHSIWHLFVIGGTICHFNSILFYVMLAR